MKLLGWMHRKLRQNNPTDPFKDFGAVGRNSLDDQQSFGSRPSTFSRPSLKSHTSCFHRRSFVGLEDDEDDPDAVEELFRGLLAIGTLGSVDAAVRDDTLSVISDSKPALEDLQFMEQLTDQKVEQISQTVFDMPDMAAMKEAELLPTKGSNHEVVGRLSTTAPIFPLQEYLIGSPVVIIAPSPTEKKEQRTSLGELFQRDASKSKCEEKNDDRGRMKKTPTRRRSFPPSWSLSAAGASASCAAIGPVSDIAAATGENKLHKILHMFNRKVHPESSANCLKPNSKADDSFKKPKSKVPFHRADQGLNHDNCCVEPLPSPKRTASKKEISGSNHGCHEDYNVLPSTHNLCGNVSNGNREHWIKTDADYLVLEL